ncbi:MAG: class I SAM-dependent methyltransferase [Syntrophobacterales bacterium]|nr:class I SAM-dependent methyltransferase [Syntrophobacterales bacterium]
MGLEKLQKLTLKGFLAQEEGLRLYELAQTASRRGPCLEIGSYCGKSTAYLGMGCKESGGILFSIDHHEGSEEQQPGQEYFDPELFNERTGKIDTFSVFQNVLRELSLTDTVVPIVSKSSVAARLWSTPVSLLFIDGGHTFEAACADYNSWISRLLPDGILAIHDIFADRTKGGQAPRCIYNLALDSGLFAELPGAGTLGVLQRASGATITDRARERWNEINR